MEGAARRADRVAQRVLPDRPHHLCIDAKRRYPDTLDFWFSGSSARLQYMTYLSDADRGVLITLPFFEIRDEFDPPKPPRAPARSEAKKKMTFKDYQNKKKSGSPTENDPPTKPDSRQATASDPGAHREAGRRIDPLPSEHRNHEHYRAEKPRQERGSPDRSKSHPLPKAQADSARASEGRKRQLDLRQTSPPPKKLKTGAGRLDPDPPRIGDSPAAKSRHAANDKATPRGARAPPRSTPVNGRGPRLEAERKGASPASSIHVNGLGTQSSSTSSTPQRAEQPVKPALPELLSPLRLGLGGEVGGNPRREPTRRPDKGQKSSGHLTGNNNTKVPELLSPLRISLSYENDSAARKKPSDRVEAKSQKPEGCSMAKKPRSGKIPPLLSPTLPPVIETELARLKTTPEGAGMSQREMDLSEPPAGTGRAKGVPGDETVVRRPSRVVVLKYKKRSARTVAAILALPSRSHKEKEALEKEALEKEALEKEVLEKEAPKKERSPSAEHTPPPFAKKRPPAAEGQASEPWKRHKASAEASSAKPGVPSTPLKSTATAMSRVTSSNSQALTPGDTATSLTPSIADRPLAGVDSLDHASSARAATLRQRHADYTSLGGRLKHTKDNITRSHGSIPPSPAEERRLAVLHFEMILAYMIAFGSLDQSRMIERRATDFKAWESLLPHFYELRHRARRSRPLLALANQVHAICLEQLTHAFVAVDPKAAPALHPVWAKQEKRRMPVWAEAASLLEDLPDSKLRANLGPWSTVDDTVASALAIMRRWADQEDVNWRPEVALPSSSQS